MGNFVIIGGSSGIGKELLKLLSESGHQVFATYFKNVVKKEIPNVEFQQLDVLDEDLNLDFLPEQIDGFVYCPGSINLRPFHRIKAKDFIADYQLQVIGAIRILQEIFPALKISGKASVVLFSSIVVQHGFNFHAQVASSKGALEGLCKSLAAEWAPHIRVNIIAPSLTNTPLSARFLNSEEKRESNAQRHPLQKIGDAIDIAEMAAFLLSDKASWITGQVIHVDGGLSSVKP
ncbi:SDR family NAD(P)-dependent oxidoreductase [Marinifilum caeruleilacunae]|uniref:SDR family oxidoreductase n=1 Tax=Marinifilum caeruleilacunae TaxID=2499076 RepID=A0ABX1WYH8_9BACT|nr:SDR family oxidoreductase [Marinifilum caeruleilacunae]NOU61180.1 SDR family oxidoreductase [Marinifilum caeruleilacunae]